jgi:cell fate regulator YaaT (PSP1 superfamily)
MGCASCGTKNGSPSGCGNKGHCLTGGCNKMNTYDWFSVWQVTDSEPFDIVEISFKKGARKGFYRNRQPYQWSTGDYVAVDSGNGYDVGRISLSGEMVRLQMKKKHVQEDHVIHELLRLASPRDMERHDESVIRQKSILTRARAIVRSHDIDMKLGDVELQADLRKATFYYTADGRVDFRELVRSFAREFNVKVEMRQIGSRQESARIGGIGSCGRELCCSTWLSDFKTVPTSAARYQNLAINQVKLSGQCGRLKCCLNYELDTYIDALKTFPLKIQTLKTKSATASFIKADIFKDVMHYSYKTEHGRYMVIAIDKDRVREISELNKAGEFPDAFITEEDLDLEQEMDFADVTGAVELKEEVKRRKKRRNRNSNNRNNKRNQSNKSDNKTGRDNRSKSSKESSDKTSNKSGNNPPKRQSKNSDDKASSDRKPRNNRNKRRRPPKSRGSNQSDNSPKTPNE